MKSLRVAAVSGLEEANAYLEAEYLPWWNQTLAVTPANSSDAHRRLGREHDLAAILSHVEERQVSNDYTVRYQGSLYQIDRCDVRVGLRGSRVRVELRLDGSIAMRFSGRYLRIGLFHKPQPVAQTEKPATPAKPRPWPNSSGKSRWMDGFFERPSLPLKRAIWLGACRARFGV